LRPFLLSGVDLMEVARFEREEARRGQSLLEELFSAGELAWCRRRRRAAEGYAMAYAVKEAVFKALGTGKVGRMAWHDVAVAWSEGASQPTVTLAGATAAAAEEIGASLVHVAVTTTREFAVGWVMVTGLGTRDSGFACRTGTIPGFAVEPPEPRIPNPESRG
jgi:holo-[acyl-carrier protein] synthase